MSRKTIILVIVLVGVTAALLAIALTPKQTTPPQQVIPPTSIPIAAETVLKINSTPVPPSASSAAYSTDVTIDTGANKVTAIQLELSFDPKLITNVDIKPGPFFKNSVELLKRVDNQKGTISYALGIGIIGGKLKGEQGKGTVAVISFTEIGTKGQQVQINFLPKTLVTAEGVARSVLKTSVSASFPIGGMTPVVTSPIGTGTGSGLSR